MLSPASETEQNDDDVPPIQSAQIIGYTKEYCNVESLPKSLFDEEDNSETQNESIEFDVHDPFTKTLVSDTVAAIFQSAKKQAYELKEQEQRKKLSLSAINTSSEELNRNSLIPLLSPTPPESEVSHIQKQAAVYEEQELLMEDHHVHDSDLVNIATPPLRRSSTILRQVFHSKLIPEHMKNKSGESSSTDEYSHDAVTISKTKIHQRLESLHKRIALLSHPDKQVQLLTIASLKKVFEEIMKREQQQSQEMKIFVKHKFVPPLIQQLRLHLVESADSELTDEIIEVLHNCRSLFMEKSIRTLIELMNFTFSVSDGIVDSVAKEKSLSKLAGLLMSIDTIHINGAQKLVDMCTDGLGDVDKCVLNALVNHRSVIKQILVPLIIAKLDATTHLERVSAIFMLALLGRDSVDAIDSLRDILRLGTADRPLIALTIKIILQEFQNGGGDSDEGIHAVDKVFGDLICPDVPKNPWVRKACLMALRNVSSIKRKSSLAIDKSFVLLKSPGKHRKKKNKACLRENEFSSVRLREGKFNSNRYFTCHELSVERLEAYLSNPKETEFLISVDPRELLNGIKSYMFRRHDLFIKNNEIVECNFNHDMDRSIQNLLVRAVHDTDNMVRIAAVQALRSYDVNNLPTDGPLFESIISSLLDCMHHNSPDLRKESIDTFSCFSKRVLDAVSLKRLTHIDGNIKETNILIKELETALESDKFWKVRQAAVQCLASFGLHSECTLMLVLKAMKNNSVNRKTAAYALSQFDEEGIEKLIEIIQYGLPRANTEARIAAAYGLSFVSVNFLEIMDQVVSVLYSESKHPIPGVRKACISSLGKLYKSVLPYIYSFMSDSSKVVRTCAGSILACSGAEGELLLVEGISCDKSSEVRSICALSLGKLGVQNLRSLLLGLCDDSSHVREVAQEVILSFGRPSCTSFVHKLSIAEKKSIRCLIQEIQQRVIEISIHPRIADLLLELDHVTLM